MLTDPAQQSNRTASRSELSNNWRTKVDAPPKASNNAATRISSPHFEPDCLQQRDLWGKKRDKESNAPIGGETLRGEDDPKTLQAIAEGRRLYVGNMPYMAKTKDVEMLFADKDYRMQVFIRSTVIHALI